MVEYTIVLAFAVLVLVAGPGGDVMQEMFAVSVENERGYAYAMSLSALPDYETAAAYEAALQAEAFTDQQVARLAVDETDLYDALEPYNDRFDEINKINDVIDTIQDPPSFDDLKDQAIEILKSSLF